MNNNEYIKVELNHWGIKDVLGFEIQTPKSNFFLSRIELKYVIDGEGLPYLKPVNEKSYKSTIKRIEKDYVKEDENIKEIVAEYIRNFEKSTNVKTRHFAKKIVDEIFPFEINRKLNEEGENIKFSCKRKGKVEVFELFYCPEKKKIKESTIKTFLKEINIDIKLNGVEINRNNSVFLEFYFNQELTKTIERWLKRELEIKLGSLYR